MLEIAKRWKGYFIVIRFKNRPMSICYYLKDEEVPLFQKHSTLYHMRKARETQVWNSQKFRILPVEILRSSVYNRETNGKGGP